MSINNLVRLKLIFIHLHTKSPKGNYKISTSEEKETKQTKYKNKENYII
jgi:hypothetical protein